MTRREALIVAGLVLLANGYGSGLFVAAFPTAAFIYGYPWPGETVGILGTRVVMTVITAAAAAGAYALARTAISRFAANGGSSDVAGAVLGIVAGPVAARRLVVATGLRP